MSDIATIDVTKNILPRLSADFPRKTSEAIGLGLFKVLEEADPRTPRDTGNLAGGALVRFSPGAQDGTVYWPAPYSAYVNFGTRHMAPRPFATDAANIVGPHVVQALSRIGEGL